MSTATQPPGPRAPRLRRRMLTLALRLLWRATVIVVPALGVWFASSLAAYRNGPVWLVCLCGALLFPLLPLAWDALGSWRRRRRGNRRPRILTFWDRLVLRTLVLNLAFLGALMARFPAEGFAAVSTRGDWLFDSLEGDDRVQPARAFLFRLADGIEWLYLAVHDNPYTPLIDPRDEGATGPEIDDPRPGPVERPPLDPETEPARPRPEGGSDGSPPPVGDDLPPWPMAPELHPLVHDIPPEVEVSIDRLGRYIADNEPVQWRRIKALHDYVADRVAYDAPALAAGRYPPQDAETVFETHVAVCAGYAQLLRALGEAAGETIVVIPGDARTDGREDVTGEPHAWNAVKLGDYWYLMDVTWDAGHVEGATFTKAYSTNYLFTPPAVHGVTHFPDEERWQLREDPISRGDFFRQPMMRARFYAEGLDLLSPSRSQVSVDDLLEVRVDNPRGRYFMVRARPHEGGAPVPCEVERGATSRFECALPRAGSYTVQLFVAPEEYTTYGLAGEIAVNAAGA